MAEIQNAPTSAFPAKGPSLAEIQNAPTGALRQPSRAEIEAAPTAAFPARPSLAESRVAPTADAPIPQATPPAPRTPPTASMSPAASLSDAFPDASALGRVELEKISPAELAERQADELTNTTGASLAAVEDPATVISPGPDRPSKPVRRTLPSTAAAKASQPLPFKKIAMIGAPIALVILAGLTWALWPSSKPKPPPPPTVVEIPLPPEPAPAPVAAPVEPEPVAAPEAPVALLLGGKPIVLEYDEGPPAVTPEGANAAAIAKARDASRKGAARLAAGDKKGAIKLQRAALKFYPGYLGAYRGLGKALAATGDKNDKKAAIKVLTVYVKAAPEAEDAAALTKLIDKLGKKAAVRRR